MSHSHLETAPGVFNPTWVQDYTKRGYRLGAPIPDVPVVATPGTRQDFLDAILTAPLPGTVLVPNGSLLIDEVIFPPSGRVIRWQALSELHWTKPLGVLLADPALGNGYIGPDGNSVFSFQTGVIWVKERSEVGLEGFPGRTSVVFDTTRRHDEHLKEIGFNAGSFKGCWDCWAKNFSVMNGDNGLFIERDSKRITVLGLTYDSTRQPNATGDTAHHPCEVQRVQDCVVHDVWFKKRTRHDVTTEQAIRCNISQVRCVDGVLDHHKTAAGRLITDCLFTDIDLGTDGRDPWESGGNPIHPDTGIARNLYWNVRKNGQPIGPPPWAHTRIAMVWSPLNEQTASRWLEREP